MIGKVIERDRNKPSSIAKLNFYVTADKKAEKLEFAGTVNIDGDITTATDEMQWLAAQNKRCKDPYMHCLLTWREGEQPTEPQVRDAVKIALEELGLENNQCVYALHRNTKNYHVHLAINRIDKITHRAIHAGGGFTKKAMERAARRVEFAQGWEVEQNAWSTVDGEQLVHDEPTNGTSAARIGQGVADREHQTGEKSAQRLAQERLTDAQFGSWAELHKALAAQGMSYQKKGSGAVIFVGDVPIKASEAGRRFALTALEKKLGKFEEDSRIVQVNIKHEHISEPIDGQPRSPEWREYVAYRKELLASKKIVKTAMDATIEKERAALKSAQKKERDDLFGTQNWKGRRKELNAERARLGAKHASERQTLKDRYDAMRAKFKEIYPPCPKFEDWLAQRGKEHSEAARKTADEIHEMIISPGIGAEIVNDKVKDIRGFASKRDDRGTVSYNMSTGQNAFRDAGARISLYDMSDATILASMQLGAAKWGSIALTGSDEYKARCVELAAEHGIKITNPELQTAYTDAVARRREAYIDERKIDPDHIMDAKAQFRAYHEAVGADRYKVTATQFRPDGSRRGFQINVKDGAPDGFIADELERKMVHLISLEQNDGRNIYYTPVSDDKHHLLIDDLSNEMLAKFLADGYAPNAIIESSPGNWQAIITVPKLGSELDCQIGNEIVARLNREYGDPKLSGAVHAHRAPGFENRKLKHQRHDGTFPTAKGFCPKTQLLAREIHAELEAKEQETAARLAEVSSSMPKDQPNLPAIRAYELHFKDILRIQKDAEHKSGRKTDLSRIDSMIAVRLRTTGHSKDAVRDAIQTMSPSLRWELGMDADAHNWHDYAARTAGYAFGKGGERSLAKFAKSVIDRWRAIESPQLQQLTKEGISLPKPLSAEADKERLAELRMLRDEAAQAYADHIMQKEKQDKLAAIAPQRPKAEEALREARAALEAHDETDVELTFFERTFGGKSADAKISAYDKRTAELSGEVKRREAVIADLDYRERNPFEGRSAERRKQLEAKGRAVYDEPHSDETRERETLQELADMDKALSVYRSIDAHPNGFARQCRLIDRLIDIETSRGLSREETFGKHPKAADIVERRGRYMRKHNIRVIGGIDR